MPVVTAFIDELRRTFGREEIDAMIARGIRDLDGTFHARENGHEVGAPVPLDNGIALSKCSPWNDKPEVL